MALPTASDNVFPKIIESMNTSDPAAPSDSSWKVYAKAGGIYARSSNSVVGPFAAAGAGSYVSGEMDYVAITSPVSITATSEATANTIVTGSATAFDGSTAVFIEYWLPYYTSPTSANVDTIFCLYDGSSSIGFIGLISAVSNASSQRFGPVYGMRRLTPSAATHTYSIRAYVGSGTGSAGAGAGGGGAHMPGFIRTVKV